MYACPSHQVLQSNQLKFAYIIPSRRTSMYLCMCSVSIITAVVLAISSSNLDKKLFLHFLKWILERKVHLKRAFRLRQTER